MNAHARARTAAESRQARALASHGWVAPVLAVATASRAVAGTDLDHQHRFLEEAEALRYAFVQGLNRVHAEHLAYADDIRRSSDAEAERRTRVDASHWQLLQRFHFSPDAAPTRIARADTATLALALWCGALLASLAWAGRRLSA